VNNNKSAEPPFPVWKLVLLLIATVGLYQFVWLYRTARDLKEERDLPLTPWHWAVAPLLGPIAFVPGHNLATRIKQWQIEADTEIGHFSEPVFIALIYLVAYLPLGMLLVDASSAATFVVATALASSLPCLALQGQINLIKRRAATSLPAAPFSGRQVAIVVVGALLAVPIYLFTLTNFFQHRGAATLTAGDIVRSSEDFFRMRINDDDWRQIEAGYLNDESILEFLGPDDDTWAIVYDSSGDTIDDILGFRVDDIKAAFRGAGCNQRKTLSPTDLVVLGSVECTGRNAANGNYVYLSRVLGDKTKVVEIIAFTSQPDPAMFEEHKTRLHRFVEGLEMTP